MSVRAKFLLNSSTSQLHTRCKDSTKPWNAPGNQESVEMRTLKFSPVYGNGNPDHENTKFWNASPSGSLELGTVNPEAWSAFELGKEYYLDFTAAE